MCHLGLISRRCVHRNLSIISLLGHRCFHGLLLGEIEGVLGVFFNESNQTLQRAITFIVDEVTRASGPEFESRETLDTEGSVNGKVILWCLELGTGEIL